MLVCCASYVLCMCMNDKLSASYSLQRCNFSYTSPCMSCDVCIESAYSFFAVMKRHSFLCWADQNGAARNY